MFLERLATRIIVEYAAKHGVPFAIVPCCSDNGMPYKPWMRHLAAFAVAAGFAVSGETLPMQGRARVTVGCRRRRIPRNRAAKTRAQSELTPGTAGGKARRLLRD